LVNNNLVSFQNQPTADKIALNPGIIEKKPNEEKSIDALPLENNNHIQDLHKENAQPPQNEHDDLFETFKKATYAANILGTVANGTYAVTQALFGRQGKASVVGEKIASLGTKLSMGVNSAFNVYNGHKQKNFFGTMGYLGELLIAALAPYNITGLLRGVSFTFYQIPNFLSIYNEGEKKSYTTYSDNVKDSLNGVKRMMQEIFSSKTYFDKDIINSIRKISSKAELLTGAWGGLLSVLGIGSWLVTQNIKLGSFIKSVGEILIDVFQVLPQHWARKKLYYTGSGISFILGSICEMISKQKNNEPITMALYFIGSGIGRILMTQSNINKEFDYPVGGPIQEIKVAKSNAQELAAATIKNSAKESLALAV
jgi:hypothetical protein